MRRDSGPPIETTDAAATVAAQTMTRVAYANADVGVSDLAALTLSAAAAKIRAGTVTSTAITEACLARIAVYDSKLDAFITVMKNQALQKPATGAQRRAAHAASTSMLTARRLGQTSSTVSGSATP